ncbi:MAG TPA: VCBS repeat-containing protein [Polyangiaceae bacterium]|jgi:hypothetical protein
MKSPNWCALGLSGLVVGVIASCSAGTGNGGGGHVGSGGASSIGGNGSGGSLVGISGSLALGDGGPSGDGAPPLPDASVPQETLVDCMQNSDCCAAIAGCTDPSTYICTINNKCGKVEGTCATQADCQNDTYCCDQTCRQDQMATPVCIPSAVPPGIPCLSNIKPGVFAPAVQCEWTGPAATDPHPDSPNVLVSPLVADTGVDSGASAEIVIITYNGTDGTVNPATAPGKYGVLRILSGQTCQLLLTIEDPANPLRASAAPALGDLDGDGDIDIVARRNDKGLVAYKWEDNTFKLMWANSTDAMDISSAQAWDGPSIHDLNDDGYPEVILRESVYDGRTGQRLAGDIASTPTLPFNGYIPILGDVDGDGKVEIVSHFGFNGINYWEWTGNSWKVEYTSQNGNWFGTQASHFAIADFGTPGATAADFNPKQLDGIAEIVAVNAEANGGQVNVYTLTGQNVLSVQTNVDPGTTATTESGGPPTIGDFDGDGFPEIGIAGATRFRVFDFDCKGGGPGCESNYVRWSKPSQDASSRQTGASIFDFDGDGQAEAIYADECFLRVYNGKTGDVLFSSYRTSGTWYESPVVADVDKDQNTELVVNSNVQSPACPINSTRGTPYVDPLDSGVHCDDDSGCLPGSACTAGFCRCASDNDCCAGKALQDCGLTCAPSLNGGDKVCRATNPNLAVGRPGIRVLRDRLDRWTSSRSIWNQHAYSITNVNDDGTIPKTSAWLPNWKQKGLNNFRQNQQGTVGFQDLPDITGRFTDEEPCVTGGDSGKVYLQATVCNRGKRAVGAALPATFFLGDPKDNKQLCTSFTDGPVPTGGCKLVFCAIDQGVIGQPVTLIVNQDSMGAATTVECRPDNNTSTTTVQSCAVEVPR